MCSNKDSSEIRSEFSNNDEDDDYMSATFVDESLNKNSTLKWSHKQKRDHQIYKRKLQTDPKSKQNIREMENELREEGLSKPIEANNKGFLLLQKMMSKSSNISATTTVKNEISQTTTDSDKLENLINNRKPIPIDLKEGRLGLGNSRVTSKRLKSDKLDKEAIEKRLYQSEVEFQEHRRKSVKISLDRKDFFTCQRVCSNLDLNNNIESPVQEWYWPLSVIEANVKKNELDNADDIRIDATISNNETVSEDEEKDMEEINFSDRLYELNNYLRSKYYYCIWCGVKYESCVDISSNCPGESRDDHD